MDPNANLQEQERILGAVRQTPEDWERLTDLRQALYDWIRDGGFEPDWARCPLAAGHFGKGRA